MHAYNVSQACQLSLIISVSFFINKNVVLKRKTQYDLMDEIRFNGLGKQVKQVYNDQPLGMTA